MAIAIREKLRKRRANESGLLFFFSFSKIDTSSLFFFFPLSPDANLQSVENAIRDHLHSRFPDLTIATLVGGAIGASSFSTIDPKNPTATNVVVLWLSDITHKKWGGGVDPAPRHLQILIIDVQTHVFACVAHSHNAGSP